MLNPNISLLQHYTNLSGMFKAESIVCLWECLSVVKRHIWQHFFIHVGIIRIQASYIINCDLLFKFSETIDYCGRRTKLQKCKYHELQVSLTPHNFWLLVCVDIHILLTLGLCQHSQPLTLGLCQHSQPLTLGLCQHSQPLSLGLCQHSQLLTLGPCQLSYSLTLGFSNIHNFSLLFCVSIHNVSLLACANIHSFPLLVCASTHFSLFAFASIHNISFFGLCQHSPLFAPFF